MAQRHKRPDSPFSGELIDPLLQGQGHGAHPLGKDDLIGELKGG